jgi:hypothetical protein
MPEGAARRCGVRRFNAAFLFFLGGRMARQKLAIRRSSIEGADAIMDSLHQQPRLVRLVWCVTQQFLGGAAGKSAQKPPCNIVAQERRRVVV